MNGMGIKAVPHLVMFKEGKEYVLRGKRTQTDIKIEIARVMEEAA